MYSVHAGMPVHGSRAMAVKEKEAGLVGQEIDIKITVWMSAMVENEFGALVYKRWSPSGCKYLILQ